MEEKLFEAITGGDYGTCEQLLDQGVNVEAVHKVSVNGAEDDYTASSIVSCLIFICLFVCLCCAC